MKSCAHVSYLAAGSQACPSASQARSGLRCPHLHAAMQLQTLYGRHKRALVAGGVLLHWSARGAIGVLWLLTDVIVQARL